MVDDDDTLMSELREALRHRGAVPQRSREAARAAFAWRTIDDELLRISHDSLAGAAALVRGPADAAEARLVSFEGAGLSIELEVTPDELIGQVIPARRATVVLESPDADERSVACDEAGIFEFPDPPSGLFRLRLAGAGRAMTTPWLAGKTSG